MCPGRPSRSSLCIASLSPLLGSPCAGALSAFLTSSSTVAVSLSMGLARVWCPCRYLIRCQYPLSMLMFLRIKGLRCTKIAIAKLFTVLHGLDAAALETRDLSSPMHVLIPAHACISKDPLLTLGAHAQRGLRYLVCPSVRLSVCPSVRLSVCPSVRLSVCPSVRPSVTVFSATTRNKQVK